jgi:hypothetical protein
MRWLGELFAVVAKSENEKAGSRNESSICGPARFFYDDGTTISRKRLAQMPEK